MGSALIIGTGVIGAATALALARDGWDVTSVDRNALAGYGSTSASSGVIRMHYSTREATALAWEGQHHWADWQNFVALPPDTALAPFRKTGCLVLNHTTNDNLRRHMDHSRDLGIPFEVWDNATLAAHLPDADLRGFWPPKRPEHMDFAVATGPTLTGGVFWPDAGYVSDPALAAQNLLTAATHAGAKVIRGEVVAILRGTRVEGIRLADGRSLRADIVVNVAGPASSAINRMAGVAGDMTVTTRPQRMETAYLPGAGQSIIMSDADIACYSKPDVGGGVSIGTEGAACDTPDWIESDTTDRPMVGTQAEVQAMRYAQRHPKTGLPRRMAGTVGIYDVSTDWLPIYDRSALPGFYMACGTSGNQFKNAPVAGRIMAALIAHCEAGGDHDRDPLRFTLPYTGNVIDLGHFSRRRQAHVDSSFSVLG